MTTARFEFVLFGEFQASVSGRQVRLPGRKERALLAYLAMARGEPQTRDRLCGLLWGDRPDKQAHDCLKQALHRLRLAFSPLGSLPVLANRLTLALDAAVVACDVHAYKCLIDADATGALEEAVALCRGEFLDGLDIEEEAFSEWLAGERRRLRDLQLGALTTLFERQ